MKKLILAMAVLVLVTLTFLKFGKNAYKPILNKISGKETVNSISDKISNDAYKRLKPYLDKLQLKKLPSELIIVGLKEEQILEVYVKIESGISLLKKFPFTAYSGKLGPKLKRGDRQIPEGIYTIEYLNPNSSYYLSMKINYPNEFDINKSNFSNVAELGDNIFIHGKAVTIGCIPIGDEAIEELFILVKNAINKEIKVIISPRDFRENKSIPEIDGIDWENELYQKITTELNILSNKN